MPYKTDLHANLGYVDKKYKVILDKLCASEKRSIKDEIEVLIYRSAQDQGIIPKTSKK